jgi:hypothetical protein
VDVFWSTKFDAENAFDGAASAVYDACGNDDENAILCMKPHDGAWSLMNGTITADRFVEFDEDDDDEPAAGRFVLFADEYDNQFAALNGNTAGFVDGVRLVGVMFSAVCAELLAAAPTNSSIAEYGCDILQPENAHERMDDTQFQIHKCSVYAIVIVPRCSSSSSIVATQYERFGLALRSCDILDGFIPIWVAEEASQSCVHLISNNVHIVTSYSGDSAYQSVPFASACKR